MDSEINKMRQQKITTVMLGITVRFSLRGLANLMAGNVSILASIR
jgi:hypothetical protein